jgi:hypothetical protein
VADAKPFVNPYVWTCVDDGDHKGCGAVFKTNLTRYTAASTIETSCSRCRSRSTGLK